MRPIPGMHPFAVLYSLMGSSTAPSGEYEMSGGASPVLFSLSACAGGGRRKEETWRAARRKL